MRPTAADYADHLVRQTHAIASFMAVLRQERDVLANRPVSHDALSAVTENKVREADALDRLEGQRQQLASTFKDSDTTDDTALAGTLGCAAQWADLKAAAAGARTQNALNGAAIQMHHTDIDARLQFLRHKTSRNLYAADGRPKSQVSTGRSRGGA